MGRARPCVGRRAGRASTVWVPDSVGCARLCRTHGVSCRGVRGRLLPGHAARRAATSSSAPSITKVGGSVFTSLRAHQATRLWVTGGRQEREGNALLLRVQPVARHGRPSEVALLAGGAQVVLARGPAGCAPHDVVDLEHDARRTARTAGVAAAEAIASEDAEAELGGRASRARLMPSRADVLPRRRGYEPRGPSHQRFDPMVRG